MSDAHNRAVGLWMGRRVYVVQRAQRVRPKCPSKSKGRVGTRRRWKRAHPPYSRPGVLPADGRVLMTVDAIYMDASQWAAAQLVAQRTWPRDDRADALWYEVAAWRVQPWPDTHGR